MKKKLCYLLVFLCVNALTAQIKTIENMVNFKVANSGVFLDENNNADGYYFFYQVDKLKKGQREYAIKILDKNLNDVAVKKFVASKKVRLIANGFNNDVSMFVFHNYKEKTLTLKSFDKKAVEREDIVINLSKKVSAAIRQQSKIGGLSNLLMPIENKGFIIKHGNYEGKGAGYSLTFYPTNSKEKLWKYDFIPEKRGYHMAIPVAIDESYVVLTDIKTKGGMSLKKEFKTVVIDVNTGKKLFEKLYDKEDPKLISNSFISENDKITVLGQYYEPKAKLAKAQSLGLFVDVLDENGKKEFSKRVSWKEDVAKFLPVKNNNKLKGIGYIYFHDIIKTKAGEYYGIGEQYKKTVSAIGVASNVLAGLAGGRSNASVTQLTIKDVYIFKFDKEFNLIDVKIFKKGTSRIQNLVDYGSPQFSAFIIKQMGGFDFAYAQIDEKRDRFYANFIDYERGEKGVKGTLVFKTIIQDEGALSEDKVVLPKKWRHFRVFPAKVGYVLLLEYNKKEKKTQLHLEKLNIK